LIRRFGPAHAPSIAKEKNDALDNLCGFVDFVGSGNGHLVHRRRADSHPVGHCVGSNGNPPDSGAQGSWLAPIVAGVALWLMDTYIRSCKAAGI
jgi:hypothetical protein